jgi:iron complex outermembrane receptor protein
MHSHALRQSIERSAMPLPSGLTMNDTAVRRGHAAGPRPRAATVQPAPALRKRRLALAFVAALPATVAAQAQPATAPGTPPATSDNVPTKSLGVVTVTGTGQPTSLPTQIPATMESVTREQIERTINATDSEDALKYLPSLLVRKRYIGDYNHAILSSRASGTGNSARSAVYADGMPLSNYLGNGVGGLSFPPRWGMVTPEEIERVDVMYGPFSAAYPGNSVGAVVAFTTRMPKGFEVHARVGYTSQPFQLYNTDSTFRAWETSASVGNRSGDLSWLLNFNRTDSHGQPLTFATRLASSGVAGAAGTPVTGQVLDANNAGSPWYVLGTGTEYRTRQDHFKIKLAYDLTPTIRASYVLGVWQNTSENRPVSYLRDPAGNPVYSGPVNIDGLAYTGSQAMTGSDFAATSERLTHLMHGLAVKSHTQGVFDWEVGGSLYDYRKDDKRQNAAGNPLPGASSGGPGTIADGSGTGWNNLALKGTWRPRGPEGAHIVDFGAQLDRYTLAYLTSNTPGNWLSDPPATLANNVSGKTQLLSVYAQDAWAFAPPWKTVLGLRAEQWRAYGGETTFSPVLPALSYPSRRESYLSPKAALSYQVLPDLVLKASAARAVRMPTVGELYGATSTTNSQYVNDPNLRPERSWTTELTAEKDLGNGSARLTYFTESVRDSLYSQTTFDPVANKNVSRVQNVGRIATKGVEAAYTGFDVVRKGLDLSGSVTYADSVIKENAGFVVTPGDTIGKRQPNIPRWRATALASYRFDDKLSAAFGARYSGPQFRTLNNADNNGYTYQGVSKYFATDLRVSYRITRQWTVALGVDNLNNYRYWNFHPYPQRSYRAELKVDL